MARPAVWMLCPDDHVISFDTLDAAREWLEEQLGVVKEYWDDLIAEANNAKSL